MSSTCPFRGTTAYENELGCRSRRLQEFGVEHVAMESAGVYWKPVWNVLETHFQIVRVNAQHIKAVPGRKTDTKDCQWIAELLQHGLLRGSFIPPLVIRDLRDLTRARTSLSQEHSRIGSRIQKVLEDANLKRRRGFELRYLGDVFLKEYSNLRI